MINISTKTGDDGFTSSPSGERISKSSLIIDVLGNLDELSSSLGFAVQLACSTKLKDSKMCLIKVQSSLFYIASSFSKNQDIFIQKIKISLVDIDAKVINFQHLVNLPKSFVIPGCNGKAGLFSSYLHVCRTVCRRLERSIVKLKQSDYQINNVILSYINRLSDLLFLMAVYNNDNKKEKIISFI